MKISKRVPDSTFYDYLKAGDVFTFCEGKHGYWMKTSSYETPAVNLKNGEIISVGGHTLVSYVDCDIVINEGSTFVPVDKAAKWRVWGGWVGNHDQRIEDATCTACGYVHPKVYGSLTKLAAFCPRCGARMEGYEEI